MASVGIALGANLGDKLANIQAARDFLVKLMPQGAKILQSPIFQSTPLECPAGSPDFYNTAVEITYQGTPEQLLKETQEIEKKIGRVTKIVQNEARLIDLDILYFDDLTMDSNELQIPHPRISERRFVLAPLKEICPDRILPNQTLTILELLEELPETEQKLVEFQSSW